MKVIDKEKNFVSLVLYVYNNANDIASFLRSANKIMCENFKSYEIICVDDKSKDESKAIIKSVAKELPKSKITILSMSYYQGLESAMNAGIDIAIGDYVFEFDSCIVDYNYSLFIEAYQKVLEGNDIVSIKSDKKIKVSSRIFYHIFNKYSGNANAINTEAFKVLSRRAINRVSSLNKSIPYRKAVYANSGLRMAGLEYKSTNGRKYAKNSKYRMKTATDALVVFTDIAYKIALLLTVIMIGVTVCAAAYTIIMFIKGVTVPGWTTTMLFISFCFLSLFIIMTIVIKYLSIILDMIFKKQKYNIESIDKL